MQGRTIGTINIFKNDDPIIKDHVKVKSVLCNCNITPPRYDSIRFDGIRMTRFKFSYLYNYIEFNNVQEEYLRTGFLIYSAVLWAWNKYDGFRYSGPRKYKRTYFHD